MRSGALDTLRAIAILLVMTAHTVLSAYALYLLRPDALALMKRVGPDMPFVLYLSAAFMVSAALAEVLYRVVELPGMRLRERLPWARSTSTAKVEGVLGPASL